MARFIFGGEVTHVGVEEDASNANAFKRLTPGTAMPWRNAAGTVQTDFLLWDGADYTIAATAIVADAHGYAPAFKGPDGLSALYDPNGYVLLARTSAGSGDWNTIANKPTFVAAGATAADARDSISAGTATKMSTLDAQTGTDTSGGQIDAATLKAAINFHAPGNVKKVFWDGVGSQPARPANLPTGTCVWWWQPTAPAAGVFVSGVDIWTATAAP